MATHQSVITSTSALAEFCAAMADYEYIAVDTEFLRETTYYAKLCLVQISGGGNAMAIDPLADGIDLSPLTALLGNPDVIKVFHAGRQDLEIFYKMMDGLPNAVYDTQIAAMVCGFGEQVGYDRLVKGMLDITLDKGSRFTDWAQRPLTEKQVRYALDDVIHLDTLFPMLRERIAAQGRDGWLDEEFQSITDIALYNIDPDEVWRRIKQRGGRPQVLNRLKHLAAWREKEVRRRDMPRSRLIKDETLVAIAESNPKDKTAFDRIRGFPGGSGSKLVSPVLAVLDEAEKIHVIAGRNCRKSHDVSRRRPWLICSAFCSNIVRKKPMWRPDRLPAAMIWNALPVVKAPRQLRFQAGAMSYSAALLSI